MASSGGSWKSGSFKASAGSMKKYMVTHRGGPSVFPSTKAIIKVAPKSAKSSPFTINGSKVVLK